MKTYISKMLLSCLVALSLVAAGGSIASAQEVDHTQDTLAATLTESNTEAEQFATLSQDEYQLKQGFSQILSGQKDAGKLAYKEIGAGKTLFFTSVSMPDGQGFDFYYELPSNSEQAKNLKQGAIYSPYAVRSGGNEWYPKIWAGSDSKGTWVRFNRSAQGLMYSAAGTALKVAICAIPGVNAVGCGVVWGATIVAKIVMKRIGRCSKSAPWLYVYPAQFTGSCRR